MVGFTGIEPKKNPTRKVGFFFLAV